MVKVYAMIADGTEEVECLAVVDVLKRSGMDVVLVSVGETRQVLTAHQIRIEADATVAETDMSDADLIFIPGGMPGSEHLSSCPALITAIQAQLDSGRRVAAICAAPGVVLGRHGFLKGKKATCFPGFEDELIEAEYSSQGVVTDGNITTAKGVGVAIDLGLELAALYFGRDAARELRQRMQCP
ncbi:MAG: DJ-1 family glyoxalase III [Lachnospiraceae bacterium]